MAERQSLTIPEMRQAALQAVRDFLRSHMLDPMKFTCEEAHKVLGRVVQEQPNSVASRWYRLAGFSQVTYFYHEWEEWRKETQHLS